MLVTPLDATLTQLASVSALDSTLTRPSRKCIKTRDFNPIRCHTYEVPSRNPCRINTYKKQGWGEGVGKDFTQRATVRLPLSFHALTNCPFFNPFVLIFMHLMGGCTTTPFRTLDGSALPRLSSFNFQLSTLNSRLPVASLFPYFLTFLPRLIGVSPHD